MKLKKSIQASLENKRVGFFQLGLIVALSLVLIAFEWTTVPAEAEDISLVSNISFESEMIAIPREEQPRQEQQQLPQLSTVIDVVDDDVEVPDVDFASEVDENTQVDLSRYIDDDDDNVDDDVPFVIVETMPKFRGGDPSVEFRKYIIENLKYPEIAAENGIGGKVYVQFVVNENGKVVNAKVVRSRDPALDAESIRVVESSPLWTPGEQRGKAVKVIFTFPINYVLQ